MVITVRIYDIGFINDCEVIYSKWILFNKRCMEIQIYNCISMLKQEPNIFI